VTDRASALFVLCSVCTCSAQVAARKQHRAHRRPRGVGNAHLDIIHDRAERVQLSAHVRELHRKQRVQSARSLLAASKVREASSPESR
jgi:hypothetical protein